MAAQKGGRVPLRAPGLQPGKGSRAVTTPARAAHWAPRSPSAPIGGAGPVSHLGSRQSGGGEGEGAGKEGKQRLTGGLSQLPVQERTSKPLCAWHARFGPPEDTPSSHFSGSAWNKHTHPPRDDGSEAGPPSPASCSAPTPRRP